MKPSKSRLKTSALLGIALASFCVVALTGYSHFVSASRPESALHVNPLNIEARIDLVAEDLPLTDGRRADPQSRAIVENTIRYAPIEARAYSQLAELYRADGDTETAEELYDVALSLSKADWLALQRTLISSIEQGDFQEAFAKFDILFRRWPSQFANYAAVMPSLLREPDGYKTAVDGLRSNPSWRSRLVSSLSRNPDAADIVYRLAIDLNGNGDQNNRREIAGVVNSLMRVGNPDLAHRLFLFTQSDDDRLHAGYVFNGSFDLEPAGHLFDWTFRNTPGVAISRTTTAEKESALVVRFLGKPVASIVAEQVINLPPGRYRLSIDTEQRNLRAPKGLFWRLDCISPVKQFVRLDVPEDGGPDDLLQADFTVDAGDCSLFKLSMGTDLRVESFRYGYKGSLLVRSVSLTRLSS